MKTPILLFLFVLAIPILGWPASVTLVWTATGDDGNIGTASAYDLRISEDSITELNFWDAEQVFGLPKPSEAGTPEQYTVTRLTNGLTYYFVLFALDEMWNRSLISNLVVVPLPCDSTVAILPDLNCDGINDISDLLIHIDLMFRGGQ